MHASFPSWIRRTGCAWLLLALATTGSGQSLVLEQGHSREQLEMKMVKNLIILPVFLNGKGPYNFVLDSGVGIFLVTDSSLMDSLELTSARTMRIAGLGEQDDLVAYVTPPIKVSIGRHISGNFPAAFLKKDAFNLSGYAGMPVHGLIGYEFFSSFVVKLNYPALVVTVFRPEKKVWMRNSTTILLTIEDYKPYLRSTVRLSSGKEIDAKLIIDTGAGHPLSLETNEGKPFEVPEASIPGNLGIGLAGPITGALARVPSISLGKFELKNVIAAFPDYQDVGAKAALLHRTGNIGNSVLKHFIVVFDYNREKLHLKRSIDFNEPFEHDMSGLELNAIGKNFDRVLISRIEPGSAGEQAGLQPDDEILSINFKPITVLSAQEIDELFRSRNDRCLLLEIYSHETRTKERIVLTLKRRI